MQDTGHCADEMDCTFSVTRTHGRGETAPRTVRGHMGVRSATVKHQRLWEETSQCREDGVAPGSHGKMRWAYLNNSTGWQETKTHCSGIIGTVPGPADKKCLAGRPHPQEQKLEVRPFETLLASPDVKEPIILDLSFRQASYQEALFVICLSRGVAFS